MPLDYEIWKEEALEKTKEIIKIYQVNYSFIYNQQESSPNNYKITLIFSDDSNTFEEHEVSITIIGKDGKSKKIKKSRKKAIENIEVDTKIKPIKILARKHFEPNNLIWKAYKEVLIAESKGICAYCESPVTTVDWGDVEHFRPKGGVSENPEHPGYYWLAYDESNYLLSCTKCNGGGAKLDHFPVENNFWVTTPDSDINEEKPLLLDPRKENPLEHINFMPGIGKPCNGIVTPKTLKGQESIEKYNLNRFTLPDQRAETQSNFLVKLRSKTAAAFLSNEDININDIIQEESSKLKDTKYSSACFAVIDYFKERIIKSIQG